jgi:predicted porin
MKKSLIALAVAGVVATPAFAASSNVDFYGKFRVSLDNLNNSIGWQLNDETSRVGFKGSEDLGGGLKAIYQWETGFSVGAVGSITGTNVGGGPANNPAAGGLGSQRNTFVGLSGDFGTAFVGRHDTPYKLGGSADLFADTLADAQNTKALCIICEDLRVDNAIAYVSPTISGFHGAIAIVPGQGSGNNANGLADAVSLVGVYANGPLLVTAGYESLGKKILGNGPAGVPPSVDAANAQTAWKLNAAYTIGDLKLGGTYENISHIGGSSLANNGQKDYLVSAAYGMGPITLAIQYGVRNPDGANNNLTDWTVGAIYSLSKRTNAYVGYANYNPEKNASALPGTLANDKTLGAFTLGLNHDF